jgi:hypothetical protein
MFAYIHQVIDGYVSSSVFLAYSFKWFSDESVVSRCRTGIERTHHETREPPLTLNRVLVILKMPA